MRRKKQILSKVKSQSRFLVFGVRWICRASTILLWARFGATSFTLADSHSTWCPDFQVCTAMPFFSSHFFTAARCSVSRFHTVLPVSPMYTWLHCNTSNQGTLQTTPFLCSSGVGCFTFTRASLIFPLYPQSTRTRKRQETGQSVEDNELITYIESTRLSPQQQHAKCPLPSPPLPPLPYLN